MEDLQFTHTFFLVYLTVHKQAHFTTFILNIFTLHKARLCNLHLINCCKWNVKTRVVMITIWNSSDDYIVWIPLDTNCTWGEWILVILFFTPLNWKLILRFQQVQQCSRCGSTIQNNGVLCRIWYVIIVWRPPASRQSWTGSSINIIWK